MLVDALSTGALRALSVMLLGVGGSWLLFSFARARAADAERAVRAHCAKLGLSLSFLRLGLRAQTVVRAQGVTLLASLALAVSGAYLPASLAFAFALSPRSVLQYCVLRRTTLIEQQLDAWLCGLAAGLRVTPALGEALSASVGLVQVPLRQELQTSVNEHRLGTPLDEALRHLSERVDSRTMQTAIAALRVGVRMGGPLSEILERSAQTLREMARLEGVLRTKTAEGKAQAFVLFVIPLPLIALLQHLDPGFLAPLRATPKGHLLLACSALLWLTSVLLARKVLDVEL